jgi:hypothetical protein
VVLRAGLDPVEKKILPSLPGIEALFAAHFCTKWAIPVTTAILKSSHPHICTLWVNIFTARRKLLCENKHLFAYKSFKVGTPGNFLI